MRPEASHPSPLLVMWRAVVDFDVGGWLTHGGLTHVVGDSFRLVSNGI